MEPNSSRKQESKHYSVKFKTSSSWSRLKDPRIVCVSRAFGGKDRHSKVCTVRGIRDRRVRLSVPTALQLYDLQDRLGLSQPSKVVDWLLDAAKQGIDKLPPLQIPNGTFSQHLHHLLSSQSGKIQDVKFCQNPDNNNNNNNNNNGQVSSLHDSLSRQVPAGMNIDPILRSDYLDHPMTVSHNQVVDNESFSDLKGVEFFFSGTSFCHCQDKL